MHATVNGVSLCSNCHIQFDAHDFPGLVFFPTDLHYFFHFEEQDWERRRMEHDKSGQWPTRLVPTPQDYLQHQATIVSPDAVGGLYRRIFLRPFLMREGGPVIGENVLYPPKSWHGCPLAALARAFHSLGTQSHLFPLRLKQQLRDLQDLYGFHDQLASIIPSLESNPRETTPLQPNSSTAYPPTPQAENHTFDTAQTYPASKDVGTGFATNTAQSESRPVGRKRMREQEAESSSQPSTIDYPAKRHHSGGHTPWKWGPNGTSEEKATFYRSIRMIGERLEGTDRGDCQAREHNQSGRVEAPDVKQEKLEADSVLPSPQASAG